MEDTFKQSDSNTLLLRLQDIIRRVPTCCRPRVALCWSIRCTKSKNSTRSIRRAARGPLVPPTAPSTCPQLHPLRFYV